MQRHSLDVKRTSLHDVVFCIRSCSCFQGLHTLIHSKCIAKRFFMFSLKDASSRASTSLVQQERLLLRLLCDPRCRRQHRPATSVSLADVIRSANEMEGGGRCCLSRASTSLVQQERLLLRLLCDPRCRRQHRPATSVSLADLSGRMLLRGSRLSHKIKPSSLAQLVLNPVALLMLFYVLPQILHVVQRLLVQHMATQQFHDGSEQMLALSKILGMHQVVVHMTSCQSSLWKRANVLYVSSIPSRIPVSTVYPSKEQIRKSPATL